jgi:hypothetical protein
VNVKENHPQSRGPTPLTPPPFQPGLRSLLDREYELLKKRRVAAGDTNRRHPSEDAVGVALSGGGIRSATLCLGLFQGLARHKLIRKFDYLSTVSGGGYFGSFFGRIFTRDWAKQPAPRKTEILQPDCLRGHRSIVAQDFLQSLRPPGAKSSGTDAPEAWVVDNVEATLTNNNSPPLIWLRESGNYLAPGGSGDGALAGAVFVRNWVAVLVVMLTTLLALFLSGNFLRAALNSWPTFHHYEYRLQTMTSEHWWWTPWFVLPGLVLCLGVIPLGWAFWLTQAGDFKQLVRVAIANLLVILFGAIAWLLLPNSSFRWVAIALGVESLLALLWIWILGGAYSLTKLERRQARILPDRRIVYSVLGLCLLPALWRSLLWVQWINRNDLEPRAGLIGIYGVGLWLVAILLPLAGLHHLALLASMNSKISKGPKGWLGEWNLSKWKMHLPLFAYLWVVYSLVPLLLTAWPELWRGRTSYNFFRLLTIWAIMSFLLAPYLLAFQVLYQEAKVRREHPTSRPLLIHWLRNKLSRALSLALIGYAISQILVLINTWGQSIYAIVTYSGGTRSGAAVFTALIGIASLIPLVRGIAAKAIGGDGKFQVPLKIMALAGGLLLALLLTLCVSYLAHGIAWRWGCPVLVSEEVWRPESIRERFQADWNRSKAFDRVTVSTNSVLVDALPSSPGANLYHRFFHRPIVGLNKDNLVQVLEPVENFNSNTPHHQMFLLDLGLSAIVAAVLSVLLGRTKSFLNLSSFHSFYTSRLVRAYQGASNYRRWTRSDASIDDVDSMDDMPWRRYQPHEQGGPLHLVNVALNTTLSLENKMASSVAKALNLSVGPVGLSFGRRHALWCDKAEPVTDDAAGDALQAHDAEADEGGPSDWVCLPDLKSDSPKSQANPRSGGVLKKYVESLSVGSWIGISGAAFTTGLGNVGGGAGTSLGTSLLCGLFNVRLGYWWKNNFSPGGSCSWDRGFSVQYYLLCELTGSFQLERRKRWYLSDGGHFENTAAYELIRRRVPFIVISDCGADPKGELDDVANLLRRARVDFAAEIEFLGDQELKDLVHPDLIAPSVGWRLRATAKKDENEPRALAGRIGTLDDLRPRCQPGEPLRVRAHAALARITYPSESTDPGKAKSTSLLLLVKPGMTDDLPADLLNYQRQNPTFPHQTTVDQFFDEAQWESYRKLGEFVSLRLFAQQSASVPHWTPYEIIHGRI